MSRVKPLTADAVVKLSAGHPVFFRGPDGAMSVEHTILDGASRTITRSVKLKATDGEAWGFEPSSVMVGQTIKSSTGSSYTVSACTGEGDAMTVVAFFVGQIPLDKLAMFSTEPA